MKINPYNQLTISHRLMVSFGIAAFFTLLASGLGIYTFMSSTQSLQKITTEYIPYLSAAHELAVRSRAISAEALTLVNAEYQSSRQSSVNQIDDEFRLMDELIAELKSSNIVDLETLIQTKGDLLESFQRLDEMVEKQIDVKRQQTKINRMIFSLSKDKEKTLNNLEPALSEDGEWVVDEVVYVKRLIDSLNDLMLSAPYLQKVSQLEHAYSKVKGYLTSIQLVTKYSDNAELIEIVEPLLTQWSEIALADNNLFGLRMEEMSSSNEVDIRVKIYDRNSKWLVAAAHATIGVVQSEIKMAAEKTGAELKRNGILLILLAITCAVASVVLAIQIGRSIGSRIEMLKYSMELHAEGKKGELPTEGTDEIGRMAAAMRKFINKIDQRESELKKTHFELNSNLSELESAQSALLFSEKRFKDFAQVSADWFWEMDADLRFTLAQGNALGLVGINTKNILNRTLKDIVPADSYDLIEHYFTTRMSFEGVEFYWPDKQGKFLRFRISGKALYDELDNFLGYRGTGSNITRSHELSKKLIHQAHHDGLTNLANRIAFETKLQTLIDSDLINRESHAVLYLDLDKFKAVNDTCGHLAGDNLLIDVSEILLTYVRDSDVVARLGGDEFGILLQNCSLAKAQEIAEKLVDAVASFSFEWEKSTFKIGVSIGVALLSTLPQNIIQIIKAADSACYKAKKAGRNRMYIYDPATITGSENKDKP